MPNPNANNENGLTFERWLYAAGFEDGTHAMRAAKKSTSIRNSWKHGEDPSDWRAAKQAVDRERAAAGEDDSGDPEGATAEQIKTIRARAYNATARAMASHGVKLTWAQADDLGDEAMGWLESRLSLKIRTTDRGVVGTPE